MVRFSPAEFESLVALALDEIPAEFQHHLENTLVTIEEEPTPEQKRGLGLAPRETLFGLYAGTPLTRRDAGFAALPDTIHLFRGPILRACNSRREVIEQVRATVVHEIGHFFGLADDDLP